MASHPDLAAEQAHVDRAYERLDDTRDAARRVLHDALGQGGKGTPQAVLERDVMVEHALERIERLAMGDEAICFGRIDHEDGDESFHIGRVAVADVDHTPLVIDWRVPAAEPFYRATGRHPMGLRRRRHLLTEGRRVVDLEDEWFGANGDGRAATGDGVLAGPQSLLAALERTRTGFMRDIVATVQAEQDEIIRAPLPGVLVVEGGPGTGKTAVALHRAAYLLYTHRFPLERQGVLVVGPNRLFLRYIEHVLPSLGETGVELATPATLVPGVSASGAEALDVARLKGDVRMAAFVRRAVADRQRPLTRDLDVGAGRFVLRVGAGETAELVASARRRPGPHNAKRKVLERLFFERLHARYERRSPGELEVADLRRLVRRRPEVVEALERMWPTLTPQQLLHDLFGAPALIRLAARRDLAEAERDLLYRRGVSDVDQVGWTRADVALLDEAAVYLDGTEGLRTFGHIVADEVQDLTPMQLRMLGRRSLSGSMTLVGDLAQATGPWAARAWDELHYHLGDSRQRRRVGLSVNYRTPAEVMALAGRVLAVAAVGTQPPRSVRSSGQEPAIVAADPADLGREVARRASAEVGREGMVAVICPPSLVVPLAQALTGEGVDFGEAGARGLSAPVTLVEVGMAKGLEFDSVVVVEPALVVAESPQGWHSLYVALTRATQRLTVVHAEPLPEPLRGATSGPSAAPTPGEDGERA